MENAAPATPPAVQTTQLFLSTAPSSVEYNHVLRMVGRDVSVTLVERGAEGIKLELPTGQVITAKGDLPFPEGTQLQVRVSVQNDLIKLQTLEAKPPSPASILGPLSQSEAAMLLQKLQASDLAEALLPLAKLFAGLAAPKEAQIQRAIESLPVSSQQILSLLLGLKDNNPALLSRALIERFEPIASLLEMNSVFTGKEINDVSQLVGNEYKLAENKDALINNLREIFLKYFASGSMKQITISNPGQYKSVFESLKSELLSVLTPLLEKTIQNPTSDAPKSNITEQIIQTLKLLPENVRNNISDSILGRSDSNIEVIAKAIIEKLEINTKNVLLSTGNLTDGATTKQDAQRLMQLLESMPSAIRRIIAAATLGNAEAEPKTIAEFLIQKGVSLNFKQGSFSNQETLSSILRQIITMLPNETRNNISTAVLGKVDSNIEAIVKAVVEKIDANIKNAGAVIPEKSSDGADTKPDAQKLAQALENLPVPIRRAVAEFLTQKGVVLNLKPDSIASQETLSPILRQIITMLPNEARNNISTAVLGKVDSNIEAIVKTVVEKIDANIKNAGAVIPDRPSDGADTKPDAQKLAQALENLPVPIRRAIASAILGAAEAEPKAIAEFLIQKGVVLNLKPDSIASQETLSPILRQIITMLPNEARNNISTDVLGKADSDIEAVVKAIVEKNDANIKNAGAVIPDKPSDGSDTKPDAQKLAQALENLPVPIRRAVASAILGAAEAEPKVIAEFLIQKGMMSNISQDFVSKLETLQPTLRQLINLFSNLSLDAPVEQMVKTLLNGDRGILEAAKGLLSLNESGNAIASGSKINNLADDKGGKGAGDSDMLANRLNYLFRFEMLNSQAPLLPQDKNDISSWFRSIVDQLILAKSLKPEMPETAPGTRQAAEIYKSSANASRAANSALEQAVRQDAAIMGEKSQTWQNWLKGSMKALADPTVFSKEAVFHSLAAKEGVNYFELPLPWMSGRPLEMWVEADKEDSRKDSKKTTNRVLMALNFSALGETRVGLESSAKRLNVRIWAEHPHFIESELPKMQDELSALDFDVQVSLQTLASAQDEAIPSIKSVINGPRLNAMG